MATGDETPTDRTDRTGLSSARAAELLKEHGPNELPEHRGSLWRLARRQLNNVLVYILLVALGLSVAIGFAEHGEGIGRFVDAIVIGAILVLNFVFGFAQEFAAERSIAALRAMSSTFARARRDGRIVQVPSKELVPGDVAVVEAGDRVPADGTIVHAAHLRVDESSLTGESLEVKKKVKKKVSESTQAPLAEQTGRLFSGSLITRGSAELLLDATGVKTELGRVAQAVGTTEIPATPLQKRLARLGRTLGLIVVTLAAIIVAVGLLRGLPVLEVLLVGVSLAVSAVPEGLPAVVTVCFAIGVRQMARRKAITRRLDALETLGAVTVICTDKTGTITENKMTVVDTWIDADFTEEDLGRIGASCSHASLPDVGEPTELALLRWADDLEITALPIDAEEVPFTSESRSMQTRHGERSFLKGAPEVIAERCGDDEVLRHAARLGARGLRTLAAAISDGERWRCVGLWAMSDPPRAGVREAIEAARGAGVRTVMITGDAAKTAAAIAEEVGLPHDQVLTSAELTAMSPERRSEAIRRTSVFARVEPLHKLQILQALQDAGEIVAMTGDGVNDAPALRGAHVGIAMGLRGTEVARGAASIILADDHFSTIVAAIAEGRRIHDNIRRFVLYLLRANFDELLLILATFAIGLPLPLLPAHILWINLMTDGMPALALATERAEPGLMKRPPRPHRSGLLQGAWGRLVWSTIFGFSASFGYFYLNTRAGMPLVLAQTGTLTLVVVYELLLALSSRSRLPIWASRPWENRWLLVAIGAVIAAHVVLLYTPLRGAFRLVALPAGEWLTIVIVALIAATPVELAKYRKSAVDR